MKYVSYLAAVSALLLILTLTALAQGTAFTYQGHLQNNGSPANGSYDVAFTLYSTNVTGTPFAGPVTNAAVAVTNGLFTTTVDFGNVFTGASNWLQIAISTNAANSFSMLMPRQPITPTPYSIFANSASNLNGTLPASQLSGVIANGNLPASPTFSGTVSANSFSGNGANVTALNAANLGAGTAGINISGNAGTATTAGNFSGLLAGDVIGTQSATMVSAVGGSSAANIHAAELAANAATSINTVSTIVKRDAAGNFSAGTVTANIFSGSGANLTALNASQLISGTVPTGVLPGFQANNSYATVGGGFDNTNNSLYATLGGGATNTIGTGSPGAFLGGGLNNTVNGQDSIVVGGLANTNNANQSVLDGGDANLIQAGAYYTFLGSGSGNLIATNANTVVLAGGYHNQVLSNAVGSVLGGGQFNNISNNADHSFIGGGYNNTNTGSYATIPGGEDNIAAGNSFAAGSYAYATNTGTFVWSDSSSSSPFGSTNNNSFNVRATGAARFVTSGAGMTVDGQPVLTLGANFIGDAGNTISNSTGAVIGGGDANSIESLANYSFIGSGLANVIQAGNTGYSYSFIGSGSGNKILAGADYAFLGGGENNTIQANSSYATIPGGEDNIAAGNSFAAGSYAYATNTGTFVWSDSSSPSPFGSTNNNSFNVRATGGVRFITSGAGMTVDGQPVLTLGANFIGDAGNTISNSTGAVIGGGDANSIESLANYSFIGSGLANVIQAGNTGYSYSFIGSGSGNKILAGADYAFLGGGENNTIQANSSYATIPGGEDNIAAGNSFAAGSYAYATNTGTFVWSDSSSPSPFGSTNNNSFSARASGGVQIYTSSSGRGGSGLFVAPGGTSWVAISDRNAKKDFAPVNYQLVLDKLARVPVEQWHYKWESANDTPNIGPMAQDFIAAFYPGRDDKGISTLEFDGVELAAIQGLNQKLEEQKNENAELKARLDRLEQLLNNQNRVSK